jgi:tetratricopeptide (TPR) repeat protein
LRAGSGKADLHAKTAAAALHTGDFGIAAEQYRELARGDLTRAEEAADGLERVARGAAAVNDRVALADALQGLREAAPSRPLGPYARVVALDAAAAGNTADALAYLPGHRHGAGRPQRHSLLFVYGLAAAMARDCVTATAVFQECCVANASRSCWMRREGVAAALSRGEAALAAGRPIDAEDWFRRAATPGAAVEVMRAAYLGLGDVALARGDVAGAVDLYQQALAGGMPGDSLAQRAQEKLNAVGKPDSLVAPLQP